MNRITSIIFDLDGTLYRSSELADEIHRVAVDGLALQLGIGAAETDRRLAAAKEALAARTGCEATLSAACQELGGDIRALHGYLAANVNPEQFLVRDDRVVAMLQRMQENYRLYIYTNNNLGLATRILRITGLEGLFAAVFSVEDFWRSKPDRLALNKLFTAIGARPDECLFVGDRYDVDLRLPEEQGSIVFLTATVAGLLTLEDYCNTI